MWQEVPVLVRIQARDRLEIIVRVDVEEDVAVMQIADARRRKLLRVRPRGLDRLAREHRDGGHEDKRAHRRPLRQVLFPVLDFKLRLLAALPVVDLELEVFGSDSLLELERRTATIVAFVRALAAEERHE